MGDLTKTSRSETLVIRVYLTRAIEAAVAKHGGFRPAARALRIDPAYLLRLRSGKKVNPSDAVLRKLGLRKHTTIAFVPSKGELIKGGYTALPSSGTTPTGEDR